MSCLAGASSQSLAQDRQITSPAANQVRDNIAAKIENVRLSRGVPDGTVSCRGNRAGSRPTIRCDVRFVETIPVTGVEISERGNPANTWIASLRPYTAAEDEAAYLLLVDRSDPQRAETVRRSAADLADIFRNLGPRQQVAVAAFDSRLDVVQDFTSDGAAIAAALERIRTGTTATELYRLTLEAVQKLGQLSAARKVLVIASDGKFDDTAYRHNQVAQEANRLNVKIVSIGYYERQTEFRDLQSLRRLSADTRGFFVETPGAQRALGPRARQDFSARLLAGAIIEAEAPTRTIPTAVVVALRHPQGATTSFTALLTAGVPSVGVSGEDPVTPMDGDAGTLNQITAWFLEDRTRIAAALIVLSIVSTGVVVTGVVRARSRRKLAAVEASKVSTISPAETPRLVEDEPPTLGIPAQSAGNPSASAPDDQPRTAFRPPAPLTVIREESPLAWLVFNGDPGTVAMKKNRIAIGRERDNDIVTDENELTVSRHHAVIAIVPGGSFEIVNRTQEYRKDVNPISVNGVAAETATIADGDVVKLGTGNYGFLFRDARGHAGPRRSGDLS